MYHKAATYARTYSCNGFFLFQPRAFKLCKVCGTDVVCYDRRARHPKRREHLARLELLHVGIHFGMLHGLDVFLSLYLSIFTWGIFEVGTQGTGAVDVEKIILNVYHVSTGNTNIRATYKSYFVATLVTVFVLDRVQCVRKMRDLLSQFFLIRTSIIRQPIEAHIILLCNKKSFHLEVAKEGVPSWARRQALPSLMKPQRLR